MRLEPRLTSRFGYLVAFSLLACAGAGTYLSAQQEGNVTPAELNTGARIFTSTCTACHGPDGNQVSGVDLKSGHFRRASTDDDLARIIQNGIPGTGMPPNNVTRGNLVALIAYIRNMRNFNSKSVALGDAEKGRGLFNGKGGCLICHRVNGKGSYAALDLSTIGTEFSPSALQDALLDPESTNLPQNRAIHALTRSGTVIAGRRLNEDTLTVQVVEPDGRLISLSKADLKEYSIEKTPLMPSFKDKLTDAELADLVAYLVSLQDSAPAKPTGGGGQ